MSEHEIKLLIKVSLAYVTAIRVWARPPFISTTDFSPEFENVS